MTTGATTAKQAGIEELRPDRRQKNGHWYDTRMRSFIARQSMQSCLRVHTAANKIIQAFSRKQDPCDSQRIQQNITEDEIYSAKSM